MLVPTAAAKGSDSVTYFLHAVGPCDSTAGPTLFIDTVDTPGDTDGCGGVGTAGQVGGFTAEYPGNYSFNKDASEGATGTFHIFVSTATPDTTGQVSASFTAGKASCEGASPTQTIVSSYAVPTYTDFKFDCTFKGAADPAKKPTLSVAIVTAADYFMGYESPHQSRIEIHGLSSPASNMSASPEPSATPGKTPGLGIVDASVVLVALVAFLRRR